MFITLIIFLFSLLISFLLLDKLSWKNFIAIDYKNIIAAGIIYFIPKILGVSSIHFLLDIGFCITIITDIIEYSVFSIIPAILIFHSFLSCLFYSNYSLLFYSIFKTIIIYMIFLLLMKSIKKFFNKDGLGIGDLYFYFIFVWYFDLYFLLLSFFIASFLGLLFIILHKIIFFKAPLKEMIPFIPCLYLSISMLQIESFYNFIMVILFI